MWVRVLKETTNSPSESDNLTYLQSAGVRFIFLHSSTIVDEADLAHQYLSVFNKLIFAIKCNAPNPQSCIDNRRQHSVYLC
jgi:hypothetical protein